MEFLFWITRGFLASFVGYLWVDYFAISVAQMAKSNWTVCLSRLVQLFTPVSFCKKQRNTCKSTKIAQNKQSSIFKYISQLQWRIRLLLNKTSISVLPQKDTLLLL